MSIPTLHEIYIRRAQHIVPAYEDMSAIQRKEVRYYGGYNRVLQNVANDLMTRDNVFDAFCTGRPIKILDDKPSNTNVPDYRLGSKSWPTDMGSTEAR